jgi:hypothetical protein
MAVRIQQWLLNSSPKTFNIGLAASGWKNPVAFERKLA